MKPIGIVLLVIAIILVAAMIVLYFLGKKAQKKKEEQDEQMKAAAQTVTMLIIDKKRMKMKDAGLPSQVMEQANKLMQRAKLPIVKAKVGPRVMTLIADEQIYDEIPVKKEVKATVSGLYITGVRGLRGPLEKPVKKKKNNGGKIAAIVCVVIVCVAALIGLAFFTINSVLKKAQNNFAYYNNTGIAYIQNGKIAEAIPYLEKALTFPEAAGKVNF